MTDENTLLNSDLESRYEKYKGIIKNFTLMSDIFMRNHKVIFDYLFKSSYMPV